MSEKNEPFDATINPLTNRLNLRGEGSEGEELRQVIRVLIVAGKVDKSVEKICALLESLPDEEQK